MSSDFGYYSSSREEGDNDRGGPPPLNQDECARRDKGRATEDRLWDAGYQVDGWGDVFYGAERVGTVQDGERLLEAPQVLTLVSVESDPHWRDSDGDLRGGGTFQRTRRWESPATAAAALVDAGRTSIRSVQGPAPMRAEMERIISETREARRAALAAWEAERTANAVARQRLRDAGFTVEGREDRSVPAAPATLFDISGRELDGGHPVRWTALIGDEPIGPCNTPSECDALLREWT